MKVAMTSSKSRAFTLIEMVVVIGGVSLMIGMAAGLIHILLTLDRADRYSLSDARGASRLSRQFRDDVRDAKTAEVVGTGMKLDREAHVVSYEVEGRRLIRTDSSDGKVIRREAYPLERLGPATFEVEDGFARLSLLRRPDAPGASVRPRMIFEAKVGKHRAFSNHSEARP
jgi:hypothetical protein